MLVNHFILILQNGKRRLPDVFNALPVLMSHDTETPLLVIYEYIRLKSHSNVNSVVSDLGKKITWSELLGQIHEFLAVRQKITILIQIETNL